MLEHQAAHRGRQGGDAVAGLFARRRGGRGRGGFGLGGGGNRSGGGRRGLAVTGLDRRDHRADIDRIAHRDNLLAHHPGDGRGHFDRDLVGFEAGDRLVERNRLAGLLQPLADRRFGDAFAQRGNFDFGAHLLFSFRTPAKAGVHHQTVGDGPLPSQGHTA